MYVCIKFCLSDLPPDLIDSLSLTISGPNLKEIFQLKKNIQMEFQALFNGSNLIWWQRNDSSFQILSQTTLGLLEIYESPPDKLSSHGNWGLFLLSLTMLHLSPNSTLSTLPNCYIFLQAVFTAEPTSPNFISLHQNSLVSVQLHPQRPPC